MDDLPDAATIRVQATHEALARLGLLKPLAAPTIVALLENLAGEHPRTACTAYRKTGEQISAEEKRRLAIRANAFLSKKALSELSDKGLVDPLRAHELTLLRASFVLSRHRNALSYARVMADHPEVRMVVRYDAFHHDSCDACKNLHDTPVGPDWSLLAPEGCACLTAPYALRLDADWLGPARNFGAREPKSGTPTFLKTLRAFLARG